jgi:hypothetical protein
MMELDRFCIYAASLLVLELGHWEILFFLKKWHSLSVIALW